MEGIGFIFNPYDPYVANKIMNGKQLTITFHVDNIKAIHVDEKVIDDIIQWVDRKYGDPEIGEVKATKERNLITLV